MGIVDTLKNALSSIDKFDRRISQGPNVREKGRVLARLNEIDMRAAMLDNESKFQQIQQMRQEMDRGAGLAGDEVRNRQAGAFKSAVTLGAAQDTRPDPSFVGPRVESVGLSNPREEGFTQPDLPGFVTDQIPEEDQGALAAATVAARGVRKLGEERATTEFDAGIASDEALAEQRTASAYRSMTVPGSGIGTGASFGTGGGVGEADKVDAAALYLMTTGKMVGYASRDVAMKRAVAQRMETLTPEDISSLRARGLDIAANAAKYGADSGSLRKMVGAYDALSSADDTVDRNVEILLKVLDSGDIIDTGYTPLNALARGAAKMMGSESQAQLDAAYVVIQPEIARILTQFNPAVGQLTDTAKREVQEAINKNATIPQARAVLTLLQLDRMSRLGASQAAIDRIKARLDDPDVYIIPPEDGAGFGEVGNTPADGGRLEIGSDGVLRRVQ